MRAALLSRGGDEEEVEGVEEVGPEVTGAVFQASPGLPHMTLEPPTRAMAQSTGLS
ncbi:hypothetical protein NPS01_00800 [Nocardioides psychrotolerans]|nr:hypothetical protein NPS01_00800 [Nocardioides psychrotolerans]